MTNSAQARALATRLLRLPPEQRGELLRQLGDGAPGGGYGPAPADRSAGPVPASFLQERLWLVEQLLPGTAAYVIPVALRIRGELETDLLRGAFEQVTDRHEILRTALERRAGQLVQVVTPQLPLPWNLIDLSQESQVWEAAREVLGAEAARGFDLGVAPLWRARLLRLATRDHILALFLHHAMTDGWSNGLLLSEVNAVYTALTRGSELELPPPTLHYGDAAAWSRRQLTPARETTLVEYWTRQLAGAPTCSELPADRQRGGAPARGSQHVFVVGPPRAERMKVWARRQRISMFAVLCAGLAGWVARASNVDDVVLGSPQTGRTHHAFESVLGPFVNSVALRVRLPSGITGTQLLRDVTQTVREAQIHGDLPFEKVVERLRPPRIAGCNPVFQVNLSVANFPKSTLNLPYTTVEPVSVPGAGSTKFDMSWHIAEHADHLLGYVEYNADLYDAETVGQHAEGMLALLDAMADAPDTPLDELVLPVARMTAGVTTPVRRSPTGLPGPNARPPFVYPRNAWETAVAAVWAEILDITGVGALDDFFALGGHSMAAMLVIERLRARTGRQVDLPTLFAKRTVEGLAKELAAVDDAGTPAPTIVQLAGSGSQPPLIIAHAVSGSLGMYAALAHEVGRGRPVLGLQPDGIPIQPDGADLTLADLANRYADDLVDRVGQEPYHLCGFSAGGRLALAVADALDRRGQRVGAVVLLDTAPLGDVDLDPSLATVLARWLPFAPTEEELRCLTRSEMIEATLEAGQRIGDLPPNLDAAEFGVFCRRLELNGRAFAGYRPSYGGSMTVVARADGSSHDLDEEWSHFPIGQVRTRTLAVESHISFVDGSEVITVARFVLDLIAEAEESGTAGQ